MNLKKGEKVGSHHIARFDGAKLLTYILSVVAIEGIGLTVY